MKPLHMSLLTAVLAIGSVHAATMRTLQDLGAALQGAVSCKAAIDARDKPIMGDLRRLGVKVEGAGDELIDMTYTLPPGVTVFGHPVTKVIYNGDSGSIFYVEMPMDAATLDQLKDKLGLAPVPKGKTDNGYFDYLEPRYYRAVRAPTADVQYPDTVVAGLEHKGGSTLIYVGCLTFDG